MMMQHCRRKLEQRRGGGVRRRGGRLFLPKLTLPRGRCACDLLVFHPAPLAWYGLSWPAGFAPHALHVLCPFIALCPASGLSGGLYL